LKVLKQSNTIKSPEAGTIFSLLQQWNKISSLLINMFQLFL